MPDVSLMATLVGTLLGFVLGALWYGPLFGKRWMAEMGFTEEQIRRDFNPGVTYGMTFVLGLISAYAFGLFIGPSPDMTKAIVFGLAIGLFWVTTSMATNYLFEARTPRLLVVNAGYHVIRFALIGIAFGLLG
jgi:hypothetical protein